MESSDFKVIRISCTTDKDTENLKRKLRQRIDWLTTQRRIPLNTLTPVRLEKLTLEQLRLVARKLKG